METVTEVSAMSANLEFEGDQGSTLESDVLSALELESTEKKALRLCSILKEDIKAADLKWSLFVAASDSFRHETCLKPFPPMYMTDDMKAFDALLACLGNMTMLNAFILKLKDPAYVTSNAELIELLFYVLVRLREPYLKTVPTGEFDQILKKVPSEIEAARPQFIFQVVSTPRSQSENKWKNLAKDRRTFYAYHGSRLENFHSIVHHGLQQHMTKNMLYGSGIYLSSELSVSLPYSPGGSGWGCSSLGSHLSCVALCELIDMPEGINCQKSALTGDTHSTNNSRVRAKDTMAGEVPHKYYLVSNNDLVRVRYLLVYANEAPSFINNANGSQAREGFLMRWLSQHKLLTLFLGYGVMLATIGFANNQPTQYYYRMLLKKLDSAIKSLRL